MGGDLRGPLAQFFKKFFELTPNAGRYLAASPEAFAQHGRKACKEFRQPRTPEK
jgi:hypothetical protein